MTTLPAFADDIRALFEERDVPLADVAILQPADPFLDMAGEDLRRRIFLTESETGETLCLRPEFTIPVCIDHIAARVGTPRRYGYVGEVFRQRRDGQAEFFQAGIEDLGEADIAAADARSVGDAAALIARLLPDAEPVVTLGDQHVFEAVLAALGLPRGWQKRLARAFGAHDQVETALRDLANPARRLALEGRAAELVAEGNEAGLVAHVEAEMEAAGLAASAGRTPAEIARRLIEKAELRSVRLSAEALEALRRFLAIRVKLAEASTALDAFAHDAGISLGSSMELFSARAEAIARQGGDVTYDASFGRPLDYYTGLVFEIGARGAGADRPLVGGGRYDRLLTMLGAPTPIPGVGFSVWLDRIADLRGGAQ